MPVIEVGYERSEESIREGCLRPVEFSLHCLGYSMREYILQSVICAHFSTYNY